MADDTVAIAPIEVERYLLSEHDGGRKRPIRSGYRPHHRIDGYSIAFIREVPFPEGRWYYPGERTKATVTALFLEAMKSLLHTRTAMAGKRRA